VANSGGRCWPLPAADPKKQHENVMRNVQDKNSPMAIAQTQTNREDPSSILADLELVKKSDLEKEFSRYDLFRQCSKGRKSEMNAEYPSDPGRSTSIVQRGSRIFTTWHTSRNNVD
jgi:hypothetical protein